MTKDFSKQLLSIIKRKQAASTADFQAATGFSREYINRFLRKLIIDNKIIRVGATNRVRYLLSGAERPFVGWRHEANTWERKFKNKKLNEDLVFKTIQDETTILKGLPEATVRIVEYAFTEMFNNAIDHSRSEYIESGIGRSRLDIIFWVRDRGIGIYNNIMRKRHLKNESEAIQDLLKGKQTTAPSLHSGEGIFFTSKIADRFMIVSERTELAIDNTAPDLFINRHRRVAGTLVVFKIAARTHKRLADVFNMFSIQGSGAFNTTEVKVRLFTIDSRFVSRSQARRLLAGLDKFTKIILDFDRVTNIGQGFADEIFRIFKHTHQDKIIEYVNANSEVKFMIKRAESA